MVKNHRNRADSFRGPLAAGRQSGNYSTPGSYRPSTCQPERTVTTTAQQVVRKFQVEKKIFQELLEVKKYQIRVGKSNEAVLVKRLVKNYNKVRFPDTPRVV